MQVEHAVAAMPLQYWDPKVHATHTVLDASVHQDVRYSDKLQVEHAVAVTPLQYVERREHETHAKFVLRVHCVRYSVFLHVSSWVMHALLVMPSQ